MEVSSVIYTIGHSNHTAESYLALLCEHNIEVVVDIRSIPYSRYCPHFTGPNLEMLLQAHDIDYTFAGEYLGGRPRLPEFYKSRTIPTGKADYLKLVDYDAVAQASWFQRGLRRLLEISETARTAIMCSEENPLQCHRHHLIETSLRDLGTRVIHIRRNGALEELTHEDASNATTTKFFAEQLKLTGTEG